MNIFQYTSDKQGHEKQFNMDRNEWVRAVRTIESVSSRVFERLQWLVMLAKHFFQIALWSD